MGAAVVIALAVVHPVPRSGLERSICMFDDVGSVVLDSVEVLGEPSCRVPVRLLPRLAWRLGRPSRGADHHHVLMNQYHWRVEEYSASQTLKSHHTARTAIMKTRETTMSSLEFQVVRIEKGGSVSKLHRN